MDAPAENGFRRWPKVELHRHLEGTVRLATAWKWARRNPQLALASIDELKSRIQFDGKRDFAHFLSKFQTLRKLYQDPRAIEQVVREAVADAAADQVRYLELRFSPDHFARQAGHDPHEVTEIILRAGMDEAQRQGLVLRFLCTIGRAYDLPTTERILQIALSYRERGIVGIDLAGDETLHPGKRFRTLMERAAAEGFGITVHAGEAGPPAHVWEAIDELHANRVGHGIRSIEDRSLLASLRERAILLEVCPTSNVHTGVVPSPAAHPLAGLVRAGVPVAISTDDPAISNITLTDEYHFAVEQTGLPPALLAELVLVAARHAFLPEPERQALVDGIEQEFEVMANLPFPTD